MQPAKNGAAAGDDPAEKNPETPEDVQKEQNVSEQEVEGNVISPLE
jgi:hypothetical protein